LSDVPRQTRDSKILDLKHSPWGRLDLLVRKTDVNQSRHSMTAPPNHYKFKFRPFSFPLRSLIILGSAPSQPARCTSPLGIHQQKCKVLAGGQ
jgi:hypothetical protein